MFRKALNIIGMTAMILAFNIVFEPVNINAHTSFSSTHSTLKGVKAREIFRSEELYQGPVKLGMTKDEIQASYGKETNLKVDNEWELMRSVFTTLVYPFGEFEFEESEDNPTPSLIWVKIKTRDFSGPRKIRVGDSTESVLEKFPMGDTNVKKQADGSVGRLLYGTKWTDQLYGVIDYNGSFMKRIRCVENGPGFGSYGLTFDLKDGKVVSFDYGVSTI